MADEWKVATAAALGAANTANALRPFSRNGLTAFPSFVAGWLTSELPLQTIAAQAMATGLYGKRRGFGSVASAAGLVATAASWAGLIALHRSAAKTGSALAAAFERDLAGIELPGVARSGVRPIEVVRPFEHGRRRFRLVRNTPYGDFGRRNHLDVWRPRDLPADAKAPVLLQVHGGAWILGKKEEQGNPLMTEMCERGWVCVAINYRLSPRATWPDHIVDVKRSIGWIRDHIAEYGGDPDYVAITGGSAGGHLSSLAALSPNQPVFQPGFEDVDTTIRAAVPFYGVYDFRNRSGHGRDHLKELLEERVLKLKEADHADIWDQASTSHWINEHAPPFLVIHGTNDSLAPVEQARWFVDELRKRSTKPVVYAELPGAQHAFDVFASVRTRHTVDAVGRFLDFVHGSSGRRGPALE